MKKTVLAVLMLLLVAGCMAPGEIGAEKLLILYPYKAELTVMDTQTLQVERTIPLDRFSVYYDFAPNGKIYIPLHENPGDMQMYVGILDPRTSRLKRIPTSLGAMMMLTITDDGTAFVDSGSPKDDGMLVAVIDTNAEKMLGTVTVPGIGKWMTAFGKEEALVSASGLNGMGGNIYRISKHLAPPTPLFPFELAPWAPNQVILSPGGQVAYFLYTGFSPADTERRQELEEKLLDPTLMEAHIDVWDIQKPQLLRRIFLPLPSAQRMVLGGDGRLYVGHLNVGGMVPTDEISVVSPQTGTVERVKTVRNPTELLIRGDRLFVASESDREMDVLQLPDMGRVARIKLDQSPALPPLTLK